MVVIRLKGGLGNQLFQFATAYSLSKIKNQKLLCDFANAKNMTFRKFAIRYLNVDVEEYTPKEHEIIWEIMKNRYVNKLFRVLFKWKNSVIIGNYYLETKEIFETKLFYEDLKTIYLDGYYQSPKYFKKYRSELIDMFQPNYEPTKEYLFFLEKIMSCNSVAIHIRRGDFKHSNNPYHYILDCEYYNKAIEYIKGKVSKPVLFCFSDDVDWCKENLKGDCIYVNLTTEHADIDEMMLMKNCNHIITANSTFSWWAAWLNDNQGAIILVPQKEYGNCDMIPQEWIKI